MIKKIRIKFIALSMALLLALLSVILIVMNFLNYRFVIDYSDSVLEILTDNNGRFPDMKNKDEPFIHFNDRGRPFSKELPHEARFFNVKLDKNGNLIFADTGKIAAIDTKTAISYAMDVWKSGKKDGFAGNYRYAVRNDENGTLIVFLDCERRLIDFNTFLLISGLTTLFGYALVSALIIFFSGKIVKPFSDNYEKQKRFTTDAGHELKTPLAIIDADASVLEMETGENEWILDIKSQVKRMSVLTNALVYLSRMEEAGQHMQYIDFPLSDVVSETAQSFQAALISQGKTLNTDIQPMISFNGDDNAFRQLIYILLDNAVKYSTDGIITLVLKQTGRSIKLSVENACKAVSEEDLKHIFDRFYRADASRNTETGGHGIGLSIAKAIAKAHKGSISAISPDGKSLVITASFSV